MNLTKPIWASSSLSTTTLYYFDAAKLISECFDLRKEGILQMSELQDVSFYGAPVIPKYFLSISHTSWLGAVFGAVLQLF